MFFHILYAIFLLPIQIVLCVIEITKKDKFFTGWIFLFIIALILSILLAMIYAAVDTVNYDNAGIIILVTAIGDITAVLGLIFYFKKNQ
jgi:hypothetical protein